MLLRTYRLAAGLSQEELAERANLSRRAVSDLERGARRAPYPASMRRLATALRLAEPAWAALVAAATGSALDGQSGVAPSARGVEPTRDRATGPRLHNLPTAEISAFVGRERELADVQRLLGSTRLLTLTGTGGVGKTRLALRVARELLGAYADGVWLADLAPLREPMLLPHTVAAALGRPEEPGRSVLDAILAYLGERHMLLVLDNCEHLLPACASLVASVLQRCSGVTLLATSREALHVPGERVWLVPPLGLPDQPSAGDLEYLGRHEAIRLFCERAIAASQGFALTPGNAPAVVDICRRLDGLPLAIELAAARIRVLTAEEISARLDDRFDLLTGPLGMARHHTLRAMCDWSHELLSASDQVLFRRLAVFAGGWTLQAAEAVCVDQPAGPAGLLDPVSHLVEKSMALAHQAGGQTRYGLLETLREFALDKLRAAAEEVEFRDRHLVWCLSLAERIDAQLRGPAGSQELVRLAAEHDNLRAALGWSRAHAANVEAGLRLASALAWYWWFREHPLEGYRWLKDLLDMSDAGDHAHPSASFRLARARARAALAFLYIRRGDAGAGRPLVERSLAVAHAEADTALQALSLLYLGQIGYLEGQLQAAQAHLDAGLALAAQSSRPPHTYQFLSWLGQVAAAAGRLEDAETHHSRQLALARERGDAFFEASAWQHLGAVALRRGDLRLARVRLNEGLVLYSDAAALGAGPVHNLLPLFAELACLEGYFVRGIRIAGALAAQLEAIGARLENPRRTRLDRHLEMASRALPPALAAAALAEGRSMSVEQALAYALSDEETPADRRGSRR